LDNVDTLVLNRTNWRPYCIFKRVIDIVLSLLTAPIVLLILAVASLAILMTMGRPVLFVQERVGLNGNIFPMYKLRTMRVSAPNELQTATAKGDDRITPLGKFLRRYHIDELPQLWNVFKGDMTLIGPRPEQPNLVRSYAENLPGYGLRHMVRPGISGWSQVQYGYASTLEETREKLEFDLFYVEQFGPVLDAKIVVKTALAMFDPRHVR
jgi:lipopolysaccharide/colanic/teichoic acid biosynthesis glycosyltransferase